MGKIKTNSHFIKNCLFRPLLSTLQWPDYIPITTLRKVLWFVKKLWREEVNCYTAWIYNSSGRNKTCRHLSRRQIYNLNDIRYLGSWIFRNQYFDDSGYRTHGNSVCSEEKIRLDTELLQIKAQYLLSLCAKYIQLKLLNCLDSNNCVFWE